MLLPPVWGPHCEDHGLRGLNPTPEGSQLWGHFWCVSQTQESYPSPLTTSSPLTIPPPPPAPRVPFSTGSANRKKESRGEPSSTDLITRQLNHGSLARNPLKVLCAGWLQGLAHERGCATSCSLTGRGSSRSSEQKSQAKPETSRQKKSYQLRNVPGGLTRSSSSSFPSSSPQVLRWPWTSFPPPLLETLLQALLISAHRWWPYPHRPAAGVGSPDSTNGSDILLATPNKDSFKIILFLAVKAF